MMPRLSTLLCTAVLLSGVVTRAHAGTPLPPAFGGGFLPPNTTYGRGADGSLESFATYAGFISKCYRKAVRDEFGGKPSLLADCLLEGDLKFANQAAVRDLKGWLPPCLSGGNTTAILTSIENFLESGVPDEIWCAGSTPLPPVFNGGLVPPNQTFRDGENLVHAIFARYWRATAACYRKGSKRLLAGAPDDTANCVLQARGRTDGRLNRLLQNGKTPPCLGQTQQQAYLANWDAFIQSMNPLIFCASPSGAFVDGAGGF